MAERKTHPFVVAVLFLHAVLAWDAARSLSPTWDEIAYPAAGLAQIKTGELNLNTVNPFLSKLCYAAPLLLTSAELPLTHPSWQARDEYRFGFAFTFRNRIDARSIIFRSRVPLLLFSILFGLLLYRWMEAFWGRIGANIALLGCVSTPVFLSRATVAQLEMPMYVFLLASLYFHCRWFETNKRKWLFASATFIGLGALCKFVILPAIPAFVLLNLFFHPMRPAMQNRLSSIFLFLVTIVITVVVAYVPWEGGLDALHQALNNIVTFDKILPYYWAGKIYDEAPSLISWAAFLVKAPLHILVLALWGAWHWKKSGRHQTIFWHFVMLTVASLGSVLFFRNAVSTIQLSPAYLGLVGLSAAMGMVWNKKKRHRWVLVAIFVLGIADVVAIHPNYGAYFNRLAGGPQRGSYWLADSDQDWGQSLPVLSSYLEKNGADHTVLCYSGSADPLAYGIHYQDLLSPALVTRERTDELIPGDAKKIYLAVGTKVLQTEGPFFGWLLENMQPIDLVGQTFWVYDVSVNSDAFQWMAEVYQATNRPQQAEVAFERARRLQ